MKILDIALKDLVRSFRSAFAIGMMVIAPLMITGLLYFAFSGMSSGNASLPNVRVGVVNNDKLPAGAPLEAPLGDLIRSMFFDDSVKSWITAFDYPDEASARQALDKQEIGAAVIVPEDFTASFLAGKKDVQALVVSDPTLAIGPQVVQNMVASMLDATLGAGIALHTIQERQQANGISADPAGVPKLIGAYQDWYSGFQRDLFHNPERAALALKAPSAQGGSQSMIQQMMGGVMAGMLVFFAFFTGAYSMMSILQEEEEGTLARLFTTPTNRTHILAGKFLAVFLSVILQGAVLIIAGKLLFKIDWGRLDSIALALTGQVLVAAGLGILLISFIKNSRQGGPVLGGALTGLGMLGGLFTVAVDMPAAFARLADFTPQGWVLKTWRLAMSGQTPAGLLTPFLILAFMGIMMFAVGAFLFRRRFA